jgi:tRNA(Ile)-lysidine synthase
LAGPVADPQPPESERLFGALAAARGIILAVSGGADSTALMVLVARWGSRPPCLVVTVDHGLRPEAAHEAQIVAANAARLGLPCRIMQAPLRLKAGNLQDWARRARYFCLAQAAREAGCEVIVTAHHLDDQAETYLMRLARGSGVYGLAAMAEESRAEGIRLVRPLLGSSRSYLAQIAMESGLPISADPSNADAAFDRVKLRKAMPDLSGLGLGAPRLAATAGRMRRAAAALDHYAMALLAEYFQADRFAVVAGSTNGLTQAPEEVGLRALALILKAVSGRQYPPPLDHTEALFRAVVATSAEARFRRTLHGVVVTQAANTLSFHREWGRHGLAALPAPAGSAALWDGRFQVHVPPVAGLTVGGLGWSRRKLRCNGAEAAAIRVVPGLFRGDALLAVPDGIWADDEGDNLQRLAVDCLVGPRLGLTAAPLITI